MTNRKNTINAQLPLFSAAVLLTSLVASPLFAADEGIYKTINADGSVVFTDKPQGNSAIARSSNSVPLAKAKPVVNIAGLPDEFSSDTLGGLHKRKPAVNAVEIISPSNNQTIGTQSESILIQMGLGPEKNLPQGHWAEVKMNGIVVANGQETQTRVPVPALGSHTFEVRIINSNGGTVARSAPVKVNIQ